MASFSSSMAWNANEHTIISRPQTPTKNPHDPTKNKARLACRQSGLGTLSPHGKRDYLIGLAKCYTVAVAVET